MIAAAASVVIVTLGAAAWLSLGTGRPVEDPLAGARSIDAIGADIGGDFALSGHDERIYRSEELIDGPTLLYFGYTFCPDVCPFDMARNAAATDILEERGMSVTPVFISIDPRRDTPEVVGDFAFYMGENVIGLTGTPDQVK
ncbi:MAG: SCO family protein, partial [Pseudomonadota bacterium]